MRTLFLLIIGIVLLSHSMLLLGAVSVIVAFVFSRNVERAWCLILGICLVTATPAWILAGILAFVLIFTEN